MLKSIFRLLKSESPDPVAYEEQRALVQSQNVADRVLLAGSAETRPEILYYLAEDKEQGVRRAIAANEATPVQADLVLVNDVDGDVRCDLAHKIGRIVPDMPEDEQNQVRELALTVLAQLARDQLPQVRAIIAKELQQSRNAPREIVQKLARDVELIVSAPILEYSPLLSDADLREIIAAGTAQGALSAIARRANLSEGVSDDVVATLDVAAIATLLANESAQIREETLDCIIDNATDVETWHEPLVMRPALSVRAIRRIAGFVASSLINILIETHDVDEEFARDLKTAARERINEELPVDDDIERARLLMERGQLDDEAIGHAIANGKRQFVLEALRLRSEMPMEAISQIFKAGNAEAITALSWKAGFSMRTAIQLQSRTGRLAPAKLLNAKDGIDYPLSRLEMSRHLAAYS